MKRLIFILCLIIYVTLSCSNNKQEENILNNYDSTIITQKDTIILTKEISAYEQMLISNNFVNIHDIDSSIIVCLKYATTDNFMNENMYGKITECYLQPETAQMLSKAQKKLQTQDSSYSIIIFDGVRPRTIQRKMWASGKMPLKDRKKFLSDPNIYSLHNFGVAVDVGIIVNNDSLLDMGTPFDYIGELAYPSLENYFLDNGTLDKNQIENREILRNAMLESGFVGNKYEWWHFQSCYRKDALEKYAVVEDFDSICLPKKQNIDDNNINIVFRVQLAASYKKLTSSHPTLKGIAFKEYFHNGMYKYTTGEFNSLSATYEYRDSLINRGYQAFVVCFNNEERIDIREAMSLLQ